MWVLTGDKVETAMNIGHACKLLDEAMNMFIIEESQPKAISDKIADYTATQSQSYKKVQNAVIVAGETLGLIQQD